MKRVEVVVAGFPTVVENMGGSSKSGGVSGISQYMGEHGGFKMLSKNTCEGVHLIRKLPAIRLQASKFT